MNSILKGVSDYLTSLDTQGKFKTIAYSEVLNDLVNKNRLPFIDVIGIKENKSTIPNVNYKYGFRQSYYITIYIFQDSKILKDVIHGDESLWTLWDHIYDMIEKDFSFGGLVDDIDKTNIETKAILLQKDNTYKVGLQTDLILIKDIFKGDNNG